MDGLHVTTRCLTTTARWVTPSAVGMELRSLSTLASGCPNGTSGSGGLVSVPGGEDGNASSHHHDLLFGLRRPTGFVDWSFRRCPSSPPWYSWRRFGHCGLPPRFWGRLGFRLIGASAGRSRRLRLKAVGNASAVTTDIPLRSPCLLRELGC